MEVFTINEKIKNNILNEFNQDLYRNFDMTITDANYIYGLYDGHINKVIDRVFEKYGPKGLREEIKYIIHFFEFLHVKLESLSSLKDEELPYPYLNREHFVELKIIFLGMYYKKSYRHYNQREIQNPNQLNFRFNS